MYIQRENRENQSDAGVFAGPLVTLIHHISVMRMAAQSAQMHFENKYINCFVGCARRSERAECTSIGKMIFRIECAKHNTTLVRLGHSAIV